MKNPKSEAQNGVYTCCNHARGTRERIGNVPKLSLIGKVSFEDSSIVSFSCCYGKMPSMLNGTSGHFWVKHEVLRDNAYDRYNG